MHFRLFKSCLLLNLTTGDCYFLNCSYNKWTTGQTFTDSHPKNTLFSDTMLVKHFHIHLRQIQHRRQQRSFLGNKRNTTEYKISQLFLYLKWSAGSKPIFLKTILLLLHTHYLHVVFYLIVQVVQINCMLSSQLKSTSQRYLLGENTP